MKHTLLVLAGAALGGVLGYFAFFWLRRQGYYGLILPGGLLGVGAAVAQNRSTRLAAVCGVLATALGLFTEWRYAPFRKDDGLSYFLLHIHELETVTLLMIAAGGAMGFWIPYRRNANTEPRKT
jgi:hypothetical protein